MYKIADSLGIPLTESQEQQPRLAYDNNQLLAACNGGPLVIDWLAGELHSRRYKATTRTEAVAKACGLHKKTPQPAVIIDLTAGLGRDGMMLASLGATVTLVERSPWLAMLLSDAINRASTELDWVKERITLIHQNAISYLADSPTADCAYLDPMYPPRKKSALVKQELRLIRELVGTDEDAKELLAAALDSDIPRVVAKRPAYAQPLAKPSHTIESGATRFDVFLR